jgi:hypothetical protein
MVCVQHRKSLVPTKSLWAKTRNLKGICMLGCVAHAPGGVCRRQSAGPIYQPTNETFTSVRELYDFYAEKDTVALGGGCAIDIGKDGGTILLPSFGLATLMSITLQPVGSATFLVGTVLVPPNAQIGDFAALQFDGEHRTFFSDPAVLSARVIWTGRASSQNFKGTCTAKRHWRYNDNTSHSTLIPGGRWPTTQETGTDWKNFPEMLQPELPSYKLDPGGEKAMCCWCSSVYDNVQAYMDGCIDDEHSPF